MKLLVTRPALDAGPLSDLLTAAGHTILLDPLLSIRFRDRAALDLGGVTGLLFTSGNGVRAFAALSKRRDIPAFAVGDRTATLAREQGFEQILSADGDVAALAGLVQAQRQPGDGLLLHVSGHDVAGELATSLEATGYAVRRAVLYDAEPAADLSPATRTAIGTGTLDGVLLFSPRTARHFSALMRLSGLSAQAGRLRAWCLSPAVADALDGLKLAEIIVAPAPTQAALLSLVPPGGAPAPLPKETILTDVPPSKMPSNTREPAIKKPRVEPTLAAGIPPEAPRTEPAAPPIEPTITETPLTGEMAPDADFVAPFPFDMSDADAPEPPQPDVKKKPAGRRSPIVGIGLVVLVLVGGVAVVGPFVKEKLEDYGWIQSPAAPATDTASATPTLHAGGSVSETAPEAPPSGPLTMMPAHEPPNGASPAAPPAPDTSTAAAPPPAPSTPAPSVAETTPEPTPAPAAPAASTDPIAGGAFTQRLEATEAKIDRLQATAAPIGAVTGLQQGVSALNQRLSSLESKPTADPASVQAVAGNLQQVAAALNDAAARIAKLEAQVQQQQTAQRNEKATVLALAELKDRLAGSGPFDGPVAVLKAAAGDDPSAGPALTVLDHFAPQGVASRAKLGEELAGLPAAINQPLPTTSDASLWQRIEARAQKLVTVQRIDDAGTVDKLPPGPDHSLAVASAALSSGDLAGAIQAVQTIEGQAGQVVRPWLAEAQDRLSVETAVGQLTILATQRLQTSGMPAAPKPAAATAPTPAPAPAAEPTPAPAADQDKAQ